MVLQPTPMVRVVCTQVYYADYIEGMPFLSRHGVVVNERWNRVDLQNQHSRWKCLDLEDVSMLRVFALVYFEHKIHPSDQHEPVYFL